MKEIFKGKLPIPVSSTVEFVMRSSTNSFHTQMYSVGSELQTHTLKNFVCLPVLFDRWSHTAPGGHQVYIVRFGDPNRARNTPVKVCRRGRVIRCLYRFFGKSDVGIIVSWFIVRIQKCIQWEPLLRCAVLVSYRSPSIVTDYRGRNPNRTYWRNRFSAWDKTIAHAWFDTLASHKRSLFQKETGYVSRRHE